MSLVRKLLFVPFLLLPSLAGAQITLPYTSFSTPTIIRAEVEANDAALATSALNRTGGTMTGALTGTSITLSGSLTASSGTVTAGVLTVTTTSNLTGVSITGNTTFAGNLLPDVGSVRDIGSGAARMDEVFARTANLSVSLVSAGTLDLQGTLSDSTGNVTIGDAVDVSGLLTAGASMVITGTLSISGAISDSDGAVVINDTFQSVGAATFDSTLAATGAITATGGLLLPDGSVGTPAARFTSDTNTGMYWVGADTIAFATGGALKVAVGATLTSSATSDAPLSARGGANIVNLFVGDTTSTVAFTANQWSGDIRFNGTGTAWGDLTYFPNGGGAGNGGVFRFSTTATSVGASGTNASVGVGNLVVGDGSLSYPGISFSGDDDGIYRTGDTLWFGGEINNGSTRGAFLLDSGTSPRARFYIGNGSTASKIVLELTYTGIRTQEVPFILDAVNTTPASPPPTDEANMYVRNNNFVIQFNDGGTVRYKYLDLTGTGVTWVHSTTAP